MKKLIISFAIISTVFFVTDIYQKVVSAQEVPFTIDQILTAISLIDQATGNEKKKLHEKVLKDVKTRQVNFPLDEANKTRLQNSGATDELIDAIKVNSPPLPRQTCACPTLSVTGPAKLVKAGQSANFQAVVSGDSQNSVTYNWSVSPKMTISGQGTSTITVETTGLGNKDVIATVEIGGMICADCPRSRSATATITENITSSTRPCACQGLLVVGPAEMLTTGQSAIFRAFIGDNSQQNRVAYNWVVSDGIITSGQGTSMITVDTTRVNGGIVEATVEIDGLCPDCPRTGSEAIAIAQVPVSIKIDEFESIVTEDINFRMDNYLVRISSDATARGYIVNYGSTTKKDEVIKKIKSFIQFRRFDSSRISFIDGGGGEFKTEFWITPKGASPPLN